jgi:hypothetical protein
VGKSASPHHSSALACGVALHNSAFARASSLQWVGTRTVSAQVRTHARQDDVCLESAAALPAFYHPSQAKHALALKSDSFRLQAVTTMGTATLSSHAKRFAPHHAPAEFPSSLWVSRTAWISPANRDHPATRFGQGCLVDLRFRMSQNPPGNLRSD